MFRFDSVQHYTESISELLRDLRPQLLELRQRHFADEAKALAAILREGQRLGEFRPHNSPATARALVAATNALLPFSLSTAELGKRREVETTAAGIADLLVAGLRNQ